MYYMIETVASGWAVSYGGRRLDTFGTHAEAAAFVRGRRSAEAVTYDTSTGMWVVPSQERQSVEGRES